MRMVPEGRPSLMDEGKGIVAPLPGPELGHFLVSSGCSQRDAILVSNRL